MMYSAETWAVKKAQEQKLDVVEMRMLRWMSGVTKLDRIRNERIRGTPQVGTISKKCRKVGWSGMGMYREEKENRQESDGDVGAGEKKERKTEAEVFG